MYIILDFLLYPSCVLLPANILIIICNVVIQFINVCFRWFFYGMMQIKDTTLLKKIRFEYIYKYATNN